jgi:hypothetical protein
MNRFAESSSGSGKGAGADRAGCKASPRRIKKIVKRMANLYVKALRKGPTLKVTN